MKPEVVEPTPVVPVESCGRGRRCVICDVMLCRYNPGRKCWLHGGWEDHDLAEAIRAMLQIIGEAA